MNCEWVTRTDHEVVFTMTFEPTVFEAEIIKAYRTLCRDDLTRPELVMMSTAALLEGCPDAIDVVRAAVQSLLRDNHHAAMKKLDIFPTSDPQIQPVSSELDEPLVLVGRVSVAPSVQSLIYEGLEVSYSEVVAEGREVDERIAHARMCYRAQSDEELLAKTKAYTNLAEMRESIERSLIDLIDRLNASARREAAVKALLEANPFAISDDEIERHVSEEIEKMKSQMGEEAFSCQVNDLTLLKNAIRRDSAHVPHLNLILSILAAQLHFDITDADRTRMIEKQRAQGMKPEAMESVEETMEALAENPKIRDALDRAVARDKALDHVMQSASFTVRTRLPVSEAAPHYLNML